MGRYAPRNTNSTAAITTVAQKMPMPAITRSWSGFRRIGGGVSGIGIRCDLIIRIMRRSIEQLRCHLYDLEAKEVISRLERVYRKISLREGQKDRGEMATQLRALRQAGRFACEFEAKLSCGSSSTQIIILASLP